MNPKILFRKSFTDDDEFSVAKKYFDVIESRCLIKKDDLIICRYSFLPFADEMARDISLVGANLINTIDQHAYIANIFSWYNDLKDFTPKTWTLEEFMQDTYNGPVVLKGQTNSKKSQWKTHMFCENKHKVIGVYSNLCDDSLISQQKICVRKFEQLITYGRAINAIPITKEFRLFVLNGKIIGRGYYWSNQPEIIEEFNPNSYEIPQSWLDKVISMVSKKISFFVIDCAQKTDGDWILIELNDGTMSGLSTIDPDQLYYNMKQVMLGE